MSLKELSILSANIGRDPGLTQGAGGNTSIKIGQSLFIKASGKWLEHAMIQGIFVEMDNECLVKAVKAGEECALSDFQRGEGALRASIETPVHAIIPQRVVVHVHSVAALSYAVQKNGRELLEGKLRSFCWSWVPYVKPGWPLAFEIAGSLTSATAVWVLQNHGLIVAADSVADARTLLEQVQAALGASPGDAAAGAGGAPGSIKREGYHRVSDSIVNSLALGPRPCGDLVDGVLYPDFAVFLGRRLPVVSSEAEFSRAVNKKYPALIWPEVGVFVQDGASPGVIQLLRCHALLRARLPQGAMLNLLKETEIVELLDWDAERYRQALNRGVG